MLMSDPYRPPQQPASVQLPQPGGWPKPIGIISIVLGVLGLLMGVFAFFATIITKTSINFAVSMDESVSSADLENFNASIDKWAWTSYVSGALVLLGSLCLLIAGIKCLKRKRGCRPLFLGYIVLFSVYCAFTLAVTWGTNMSQEQADGMTFMNPEGNSPGMMMVTKISGSVGALFYLVYPMFLLFWIFVRHRSKQDIGSQFT